MILYRQKNTNYYYFDIDIKEQLKTFYSEVFPWQALIKAK